jgi:hypothetical protein
VTALPQAELLCKDSAAWGRAIALEAVAKPIDLHDFYKF